MIKPSFYKDISSKHLLHKSLALFWHGLLNKVIAMSLILCCLSVSANPENTDISISYASEETKEEAFSCYNVDTVPNPRLENYSFHVSDPSSLLQKDTVTYLNEKLTSLEKNSDIESAVVILPSIGDKDVFEFSQDLFRKWGIGHKDKNDGLLITYLEDQHVIRFHTGYGLEGALPDAICKRIQQQDMIPYFKKGKLDEGLKAGIDALYKRLVSEGDNQNSDDKNSDNSAGEDNSDDDDLVITLITVVVTVVLILIVAIGVMLYHKFEKCPQCGKRGTLKIIKNKTKHKHHRSYLKVTRRCSNCGYEDVNTYDLDDDDDSHYFSSGGFGGSSGGGSFGGGFSGGSSGGGGASSRW